MAGYSPPCRSPPPSLMTNLTTEMTGREASQVSTCMFKVCYDVMCFQWLVEIVKTTDVLTSHCIWACQEWVSCVTWGCALHAKQFIPGSWCLGEESSGHEHALVPDTTAQTSPVSVSEVDKRHKLEVKKKQLHVPVTRVQANGGHHWKRTFSSVKRRPPCSFIFLYMSPVNNTHRGTSALATYM